VATPSLAERLHAGETIVSAWSTLPEPIVAELMARADLDAVTLDSQHGLHTVESLMRCIGAVRMIGKPAVVRLPLADFALASRALDLGADGVIAPLINTGEDARALVAATKYPPIGERSWGPLRTMTLHGVPDMATQLRIANASTFALAMIETEKALANIDDILSVPGLDGVFVGPSDLSLTLSSGDKITPTDDWLDSSIRQIADRAGAAKKITGAYAVNPARVRRFREFGYRFFALGSDQIHLGDGMRAMIRDVAELRGRAQ
jgi:4-hydroxy-2-oxoheptanedioate aldolase